MAIEIFDGVRLARPWALALLGLLPVLTATAWLAGRSRSRALARFGNATLFGEPARRGSRHWGHVAFLAGFVGLVIAAAGPGWGTTEEAGVVVGRDVVVALDMSRSMAAEDMARSWEGDFSRFAAARAALTDLADAVQRRGGHRMALIVFAARPDLVVPPTTDYDHFRVKLAELEIDHPPPRTGPGETALRSGTRMGAAVSLAVDTHDPAFTGGQDVFLVGDGDDPGDDEEWRAGIDAARRAEIPVHVVGFGDAEADAPIPAADGGVLRSEGVPVRTRMRADVLRRIAEETRGLYVPAGRRDADLGSVFRDRIEPLPARELPEEARPRPRDRSPWFFAPALALLLLAWWLEDRPGPSRSIHP